MTQREPEKAYYIPRRTIINKLKQHHLLPVGRPKVFSDEEENSFVGNIIAMSDYGFPIDHTDLRFIIKSYLGVLNFFLTIFLAVHGQIII